MSDKVHHEHWCKCSRWGSFGNTDAKGNVVWTCGPSGCVNKASETSTLDIVEGQTGKAA